MRQSDVAKEIGISDSALSRYESGSPEIGSVEAIALAHLFGVTVEMLVAEDLTKRFPDQAAYLEYRKEAEAEAEREEKAFEELRLMPHRLAALIEVVGKEIEGLGGSKAKEISARVEALAREKQSNQ